MIEPLWQCIRILVDKEDEKTPPKLQDRPKVSVSDWICICNAVALTKNSGENVPM